MKKIITLIALTSISIYYVSGQSPAVMNNWVFGWFAGHNFTSNAPYSFNGTGMISEEGCVSYSDAQGNLLFYSNGGDIPGSGPGTGFGGVWNRNFQLMPNGNITGLAGCNSSPQSALIVPKSSTEYYMFTIGCSGYNTGLRKSIIDMSLDGGLGDLSVVGDVVLDNSTYYLAEGLTGTRHANGTDVWLVVHDANGINFHVFLVSATGISSPVTQSVGLTSSNYGQIRFNLQGSKIAFNREIFDFDNTTGIISNPVDLAQDNGWGRAFSASGRYLYQNSLYGELYQFDVESSDIAASKVQLIANPSGALGGMQIGPDLKIYLSQTGAGGLNVIDQPELPGIACNYTPLGMLLFSGTQSTMGLPNYIDSDLNELVGVADLKEMNKFSFFPNPTKDFIVFDSNRIKEELIVRNIVGEEVNNWRLEGNRLDVRDMEAGLYMLQFGAVAVKFVKQ